MLRYKFTQNRFPQERSTDVGRTLVQLVLLYNVHFKFDVIHASSPHHGLSFRSSHPHPINISVKIVVVKLPCTSVLLN